MLVVSPYTCNVPNVVFLEAAKPLGGDLFEVYFGGADNTIGSAIVQVTVQGTTPSSSSSTPLTQTALFIVGMAVGLLVLIIVAGVLIK